MLQVYIATCIEHLIYNSNYNYCVSCYIGEAPETILARRYPDFTVNGHLQYVKQNRPTTTARHFILFYLWCKFENVASYVH